LKRSRGEEGLQTGNSNPPSNSWRVNSGDYDRKWRVPARERINPDSVPGGRSKTLNAGATLRTNYALKGQRAEAKWKKPAKAGLKQKDAAASAHRDGLRPVAGR
jgi:hypothetical protein